MHISTQVKCFHLCKQNDSVPLILLDDSATGLWISKQTDFIRNSIKLSGFGTKNNVVKIADTTGELAMVICLLTDDMYCLAQLPKILDEGNYYVEFSSKDDLSLEYLGFGLGCYDFIKYRKAKVTDISLYLPKEYETVLSQAEATYIVRDMISTPSEDMGPSDIAVVVKQLSNAFGAKYTQIVGQDLVKNDYMGIYTVGRGSHRDPVLATLEWGDDNHPLISIVGKGVSFDTGGLDIKPAAGMRLMHKDMGGSANAIGLAYLIMKNNLPIRLNLVIPTVDNVTDALSYKPSDIIKMKNGTTVEVTNTDAEGRLILAEPLFEQAQLNPELLIDFATLTGAARVAVGTEIAAYFTNNDELAGSLNSISQDTQDDVWRLPIAKRYKTCLKSEFADIANADLLPFAGSTKAALFLQHFVGESFTNSWVHFDIMAWNIINTPGKPIGGEMMGVRTMFEYLCSKYQ